MSGKRTLAKVNAFDLVVTLALGSTLATAVLNASVPRIASVVASAPLIGLQVVVAWAENWTRVSASSNPDWKPCSPALRAAVMARWAPAELPAMNTCEGSAP